MAGDYTKIFAGPARVFAGITNPASAAPPTWMTHTAGVPATGTDLGFTQGDCEFEFHAPGKLIEAEQSLAPVDIFTIAEMVKLKFALLERNYVALQLLFGNIGKVNDGTRTGFYAGNGTGVLAPTVQGIMLSGIQRNAPTKFEIAVIYRATNLQGFKTIYNRQKEAVVPVEITALADTSRTAGDQLMQWSHEN